MPRPAEKAALAAMRDLAACGWHLEQMMKDAALEAMLQRGFPQDVSERAIDAMWNAHFKITQAN